MTFRGPSVTNIALRVQLVLSWLIACFDAEQFLPLSCPHRREGLDTPLIWESHLGKGSDFLRSVVTKRTIHPGSSVFMGAKEIPTWVLLMMNTSGSFQGSTRP